MKNSLRSIANTLLVVSVLGLFVTTLGSLSFQCGTGAEGCMAALFGSFEPAPYVTDFGQAQTTAATPLEGSGWVMFVQLVSVYALFTAVAILVILECLELYYLRKMVHSRRFFRLK
jgi:hypothetical protein